ncbi:MAG: hypothetical protein IGBAC_0981 [Ignavibacteriae bacterium]|nr:MAG: hypothetical protein IGBAC_0981 [Ignavibacteriota bacterium]
MKKYFILTAVLIIFCNAFSQIDEAKLLRFPAIFGNQLVFTYAGDLYTVSAQGGIARKLTSFEGYEMFARFSPDGKFIAFTGEYDGNREVYLMSSEGGEPKRLTYSATLNRDDVADRMGPNNIVMGWKNDGKHIVFRSRMREFNDFKGQLYLASIEGGIPEQLPLPRGGFCSFSPDDKKLAYNRVFREFRTWKRYRGGMADDIWIYDFQTKKTENITNNPAQDIIPMWIGNKIYFLSDRDENKRMNLFVYDLNTKQTKQLTFFKDYDIKFPSNSRESIVFENGGYIYKFDISNEKYEKISIKIANDLVTGRNQLIDASKNITNYEISPDGKRALFGARGDIFTVPEKYGNIRNLTQTPGVHERNSLWSPDGKYIAYISDASGEDEIYIMQADQNGSSEQLTFNSDTYKYQIIWSPDSRKIMWADKKLRLRYVDIQTKKVTDVAQAEEWEFSDYNWSPDSKWITYSKPEVESMSKIYIFSVESGKTFEVTDGWYTSTKPVFSSDGKYLFFVSDRDFNPIYGRTEWNHIYLDMSRIYLITLNKDIKSPFEPKSDEVEIPKQEEKQNKDVKSKDQKGTQPEKKEIQVKIDFDGIKNRIAALPIDPADYRNLASVGDKLYYIKRSSKDTINYLKMFEFDKLKETELGNIDGFEISANGKKMLVSKDKRYAIIELPSSKLEIKDYLNTSPMEMFVDRKAEWKQIFNECWRQMRDFFYAPNMHGVDWKAVKANYEPLVEYVNHRADLTYIIGEMVGELNAGHAYVGGGDVPSPKRIQTGLLGAQVEKDPASQYFRIKKILKGENWTKNIRSPLTEIGVNAREGDYILAVNGKSTKNMVDIYESLVNTVGKQVKLKINSQPKEQGSREVVVIPIADESGLYYYNWVQNNLAKVEKATNGKVGYIHVPDMGVTGLNEFVKYFYPQLRKKALIIDVRGNGGGNVSPMLIERLRREIVMFTFARNTIATPDPEAMIWGPKVCLLDEFSASDGDLFPYRFKKYKLGKLIGKRSWGGVVGIRGTLPLLDGGYLMKPEFSRYDDEGKGWIIEGEGVEPDIYVDNDPAKEFEGIDEQLDKAIEVILEELKTQEKQILPIPPYPDKSK